MPCSKRIYDTSVNCGPRVLPAKSSVAGHLGKTADARARTMSCWRDIRSASARVASDMTESVDSGLSRKIRRASRARSHEVFVEATARLHRVLIPRRDGPVVGGIGAAEPEATMGYRRQSSRQCARRREAARVLRREEFLTPYSAKAPSLCNGAARPAGIDQELSSRVGARARAERWPRHGSAARRRPSAAPGDQRWDLDFSGGGLVSRGAVYRGDNCGPLIARAVSPE